MSQNQFLTMMHGINPDRLEKVIVESMNEYWHKASSQIVQPKMCFDNCFQLAINLNVTYVLGIYHNIIPIEHAWLKVGDIYIDPTLEIVKKEIKDQHQYSSLIEIRPADLISFVTDINEITKQGCYPPMFSTARHHPKCVDLFLTNKEVIRLTKSNIVHI